MISKQFTHTHPINKNLNKNHKQHAANARSVVESPLHNDHHHQQHNQLVSNRHQGGTGTNSIVTNSASGKLTQQSQFSGNNQNRCQQGWMWFNNKCWVTTQSRRDFTHALDLCKKMYNSTLPTIHSEEENEFLRNNLELNNSPIWLFARHNHQYNKTRWLDKSPVDYTHWDDGQPSDKSSLICIKTEDHWYMKKAPPVDGQTECVSFWEDAKWGTQVGCQVLLPVVCERKLTPMSRLSDGPNGSVSQYEQQMAAMSGAFQTATSQSSILLTITMTFMAILLNGSY